MIPPGASLSGTKYKKEILEMREKLLQLVRDFIRDDSGQDLIEYALVVALICFAAIVGMSTVAGGINLAFSKVATKLSSAIT
jgi:pilus assembly protein Flp/PilA